MTEVTSEQAAPVPISEKAPVESAPLEQAAPQDLEPKPAPIEAEQPTVDPVLLAAETTHTRHTKSTTTTTITDTAYSLHERAGEDGGFPDAYIRDVNQMQFTGQVLP